VGRTVGEDSILGEDQEVGGYVLVKNRKSCGSQVSITDKEKIHFGFKACPYIIEELDNILVCSHARNSGYFKF
jgi:hypothetical protein